MVAAEPAQVASRERALRSSLSLTSSSSCSLPSFSLRSRSTSPTASRSRCRSPRRASPATPNGTVTVSVTDEGTIAWNKDLVTLDEFLQRLQQFKRENPDGRILINGDEKAFFAQAIYVFDEARKAGFTKVYVETRSK